METLGNLSSTPEGVDRIEVENGENFTHVILFFPFSACNLSLISFTTLQVEYRFLDLEVITSHGDTTNIILKAVIFGLGKSVYLVRQALMR